jgi:ATP-dependent phosphofructokinase / diphosphate-dependent phosphofructokinase
MSKRVAILVGGGDVPGLNVCLKSLVYRLSDEGFEAIGVRKGWEGLMNYNLHDPTTYGDYFVELIKGKVRAIDRHPGSFLHASRLNPQVVYHQRVPAFLRQEGMQTQDLTKHIMEVIERLKFHALVTIGDDDMLLYAAHLSQLGVPIVAIPATIHNNIYGTDYSIGFSTGLAKGVSYIHELRALAGSREQILVVETYGIGSGLSSLMTSFLAGADRAIIPEVPYDPEKLAAFALHDKQSNPGNYAVITVADGAKVLPAKLARYVPHLSAQAQSAVSQPQGLATPRRQEQIFNGNHLSETTVSLTGSGVIAAELLQLILKEEVFMQSLTYLLRTGPPDGQDLLGASNFAILAARLVREGRFGRMTSYERRYNITDIPLSTVTQGVNAVNVNQMYDIDNYKPKVDLIWAALEAD